MKTRVTYEPWQEVCKYSVEMSDAPDGLPDRWTFLTASEDPQKAKEIAQEYLKGPTVIAEYPCASSG